MDRLQEQICCWDALEADTAAVAAVVEAAALVVYTNLLALTPAIGTARVEVTAGAVVLVPGGRIAPSGLAGWKKIILVRSDLLC